MRGRTAGRGERGERDRGEPVVGLTPAAVVFSDEREERRREEKRNATRSVDALPRLVGLASENEASLVFPSFPEKKRKWTGEKRITPPPPPSPSLCFYSRVILALFALSSDFAVLLLACIGNRKSTPWIMFLPRGRGESAVRRDDGGNSRMKTEGGGIGAGDSRLL